MSAITQVMLMHTAGGTPGLDWSYRGDLASNQPAANFAYGGVAYSPSLGMYVAAGSVSPSGGGVLTSTNGLNWTNQGFLVSPWGNNACGHVFWLNNQFIVTSKSNLSNKIATSPDGTTWTIRTTTISGQRHLAFNGSRYVLVGVNGQFATSTDDCVTWTAAATITGFGTNIAECVNWNGSQFVVVGDAGRGATSTNGTTWVSTTTNIGATIGAVNLFTLDWNGSVWLTAGASGRCGVSSDGASWTSTTSNLTATGWNTSTPVTAALWDGTHFNIGGGSIGQLAYSTDGSGWTYNSSLITASGSGFGPPQQFAYKSSATQQYVAVSSFPNKNAGTSV